MQERKVSSGFKMVGVGSNSKLFDNHELSSKCAANCLSAHLNMNCKEGLRTVQRVTPTLRVLCWVEICIRSSSRGSSVGIVTRLQAVRWRTLSQTRGKVNKFCSSSEGFGTHTRVKRPRVQLSTIPPPIPLLGAITNAWSCISTSPGTFKASKVVVVTW